MQTLTFAASRARAAAVGQLLLTLPGTEWHSLAWHGMSHGRGEAWAKRYWSLLGPTTSYQGAGAASHGLKDIHFSQLVASSAASPGAPQPLLAAAAWGVGGRPAAWALAAMSGRRERQHCSPAGR